MSLADAFKSGYQVKRQAAVAPKAEASVKPDDGLGPLREAAASSHGKRKAEYEAAIKKASTKPS